MQRQKSILSFLQKSSSQAEDDGTDTPPEKPRRVFISPMSGSGGGKSSQPVSSILQKFSRSDQTSKNGSQDNISHPKSISERNTRFNKQTLSQQNANPPLQNSIFSQDLFSDMPSFDLGFDFDQTNKTPINQPSNKEFPSEIKMPCFDLGFGNSNQNKETPMNQPPNKEFLTEIKMPCFELNFDDREIEPETPSTRPFVPRVKRVQDESPKCTTNNNNNNNNNFPIQPSPFFAPNKKAKPTFNKEIAPNNFPIQPSPFFAPNKKARPKFNEEITPNKKTKPALNEQNESGSSKFEWLNNWNIRDKNGRRPDDPLYDKRSLFIPPDAFRKMSASQKQYWSVKCEYMDVVLFFKVGKFYELYEIDAEIGQKELDWKMTVSGVGKCRQVGISEAGIDEAEQKLIARGYKVGRIEQLETADQAKTRGSSAVIKRQLVHVSTASTVVDGSIGPDAVHLLALTEKNKESGQTEYGFAFLDYAALKIWVGSISDDDSCASLGALLIQVSPREVIFESSGLSKQTQQALKKYSSACSVKMQLTPSIPGTDFLNASQVQNIVHSKGYFGKSGNSWSTAFDYSTDLNLVLCSLGGLISHLSRLMLEDALKNGELLPYHVYKSCLRMDGQTLVNLEIFSNNVDGGLSGTLCKHLDHCLTPGGKRLLKTWLSHPLSNTDDINARLDIVSGLVNNPGLISAIHEGLRRVPDLERLSGRVRSFVGASLADLMVPLVGQRVLKQRVKTFGTLVKGLRNGINLLNVLQRENHGILSLTKLVNSIPTLSELDKFVHKLEETLDTNFPKYQDHKIQDSDGETITLLTNLFSSKSTEFSHLTTALSKLDVLQSFAAASLTSPGPTTRPVFLSQPDKATQSPVLRLKGLWHPYAVSESVSGLVRNDLSLNGEDGGRTLLLTGPNMGGKSTLMRATCLSVVLAQLGCYVPCESCELTPADIIFTRLGATDRIMSGESTFYIECAETASVLKNATENSLVLLDELGRGTSTFDGYAIAYAVFRHLVEKVCCRLLFATHYHPLTKEFASHPKVSLKHMSCIFQPKTNHNNNNNNICEEQELVFLYKLTSGPSPESYGLQVALMAGIPQHVVKVASQASERMKELMSESFRSSEGRAEFSSLHEDWLKTLLAVSGQSKGSWDEDVADTVFCLWHEIRSQCKKLKK
ncbi:hypothetical protein LUZ60_009628 [Juncus effusus]|nr:hypothetical protein LUZ60_009628 [Juncus effusus]